MMMKHLTLLWVGFTLAACGGDDSGVTPDALHAIDAASSDGAPPPPCDYDESSDGSNATTAESTGLVVGSGVRICGSVAARAPSNDVFDTDRYKFTVGEGGPFLVRVDAQAGGVAAIQAAVSLAAGGAGSFRNNGVYIGDHLVFSVGLEAAEFTIEVVGADTNAISEAVPYAITIEPDDPASRCATITGEAAYAEASDTPTNTGNDMVQVTWGPFAATQTAAVDTPEASASALTISAGMSYKASGTAGLPSSTGAADAYEDRDTYVLATGAETNELAVRLSWAGGDADLDFLLFAVPSGTSAPIPLSFGSTLGTAGPEFATTATLRSTQYWLWVGEFDGTVPVSKPYELTICGYGYSGKHY